MSIEFIYPEFEVIRNDQRCIACRVCERQCANDVHQYDPERGINGERRNQLRRLPALRVTLPDTGR